jgi:glyoxalase family protein
MTGEGLHVGGLHHVTMLVRDAERSAAFYADVLGLTVVERTRNPDDPDARHVWVGDAAGRSGTLVSFLEYPALEPGTVGRGSTHHVALTVASRPELEAWRDALRERGVETTEILDRGRFASLYLRDPDGHLLELATPGLWTVY